MNEIQKLQQTKMKTSGYYFKVGDTFIDSDLNVKAECVDDLPEPCVYCIYDHLPSCTKDNTPICLASERTDNIEVKFIKID